MTLQGNEKLIKRDIPVYIVTIIGLLVIVDYYIPMPAAYGNFVAFMQQTCMLIAAIAVGLGLVSLTRAHLKSIRSREPGKWYFSVWLIGLMYTFILVGIITGSGSTIYTLLFDFFLTPPRIATTSIYGFMVIGAIFVSLKVRNLETLIFGGVMAIRLLARAPLTDYLFPIIGTISVWIEEGLNVGAGRAWIIAVGVGLITASLQILAGRESKALGGGVD